MNATAKDDDAKRLLELLEEQAETLRVREAVESALDAESMRHELTPLIRSSDQVLPDGNLIDDMSRHPHQSRALTVAQQEKQSHRAPQLCDRSLC